MSSFIVYLKDIDVDLGTDQRLGAQARIHEAEIEEARRLIFPLLFELHPIEAAFVFLDLFLGKPQEDIAALFGCTQSAVSNRLQRAAARLRFICSLPQLDEDLVDALLEEYIPHPVWRRAMCYMMESTSHASVARYIDISQGGARQMFLRSFKLLKIAYTELTEGSLPVFSRKLVRVLDRLGVLPDDRLGYVRDSLRRLIVIYTQITKNYSILSKERCGVQTDMGALDISEWEMRGATV